MWSAFELYELCVQKPAVLVPLLRGIHGGVPRVLAEDFCGTAALSRAWCAGVQGGRAIGTDLDPAALEFARRAGGGRGRGARARTGGSGRAASGMGGLTLRRGDVRAIKPGGRPRPDVIFVGNFSIGEIHARRDLVGYLRACRARLKAGGVFVCDTYGGESAFRTGAVQRVHAVPGTGQRVRYTWEQRTADPLTGRVENALHFRVLDGSEVVQEVTDAFVYRWRLWSVPELRDALREAGFATAEVFSQVPDAEDSEGNVYVEPVRDATELGESYIVCVAGRTATSDERRAMSDKSQRQGRATSDERREPKEVTSDER